MATYNCFLDTHVLSDFLFQFDSSLPNSLLEPKGFLTSKMLQKINPLIEGEGRDGIVITSVFNFVEVLNKFDEIYSDDAKKMMVKLYGFLNQTPEWFLIDDMNICTANALIDVPIRNHFGESISGDDAILIATALLRDNVFFCTFDNRLEGLNIKNMSFIK